MSDEVWDSNGFSNPDFDSAQGAITAIRTTMQVMTYLNFDDPNDPNPGPNENCATVVNNVVAAYGRYQERVLAVTSVQINPREMYQEYILGVIVPNIEHSVETWVLRRIAQLQDIWQPLIGQNPYASGINDMLTELRNEMEDFVLNTGLMDFE